MDAGLLAWTRERCNFGAPAPQNPSQTHEQQSSFSQLHGLLANSQLLAMGGDGIEIWSVSSGKRLSSAKPLRNRSQPSLKEEPDSSPKKPIPASIVESGLIRAKLFSRSCNLLFTR
jgi:hypothetical protein